MVTHSFHLYSRSSHHFIQSTGTWTRQTMPVKVIKPIFIQHTVSFVGTGHAGDAAPRFALGTVMCKMARIVTYVKFSLSPVIESITPWENFKIGPHEAVLDLAVWMAIVHINDPTCPLPVLHLKPGKKTLSSANRLAKWPVW